MFSLIKKGFICCILFSNAAAAQSYSKQEIKKSADSALHKVLGETLYSHCKYNKTGYYSYKSPDSIIHWQMLKKYRYVPGNLISASLSYRLNYTTPLCVPYNKIKGDIYINLDNRLQLATKPNLKFIPDFIWNHENCNLLTKEEAMALANKSGFKKGKNLKESLQYDTKSNTFKWSITNEIPKDSTLHTYYREQIYIIDARTKKIINAYTHDIPTGSLH